MDTKKRIIIILTVVLGIILLFVLIGGGPKKKAATPATQPKKALTLNDYATRDSTVTFTSQGLINSEEEHRSMQISVSRGTRTIKLIKGFQNTVIQSASFTNNPDAYNTFIHALSNVGFGATRKSTITDETGVCPTGQRFIYQLSDNNDEVFRLWSASCTPGTTTANASTVDLLFQRQIPDYATVTAGWNPGGSSQGTPVQVKSKG